MNLYKSPDLILNFWSLPCHAFSGYLVEEPESQWSQGSILVTIRRFLLNDFL